jgi:hypothetical protein
MNTISLEQAWHILDSLNELSNQQTKDFWNRSNEQEAIHQQSICFRNNFLNLDKSEQEAIRYWIIQDDEFQDCFKCFSGNDFITSL